MPVDHLHREPLTFQYAEPLLHPEARHSNYKNVHAVQRRIRVRQGIYRTMGVNEYILLIPMLFNLNNLIIHAKTMYSKGQRAWLWTGSIRLDRVWRLRRPKLKPANCICVCPATLAMVGCGQAQRLTFRICHLQRISLGLQYCCVRGGTTWSWSQNVLRVTECNSDILQRIETWNDSQSLHGQSLDPKCVLHPLADKSMQQCRWLIICVEFLKKSPLVDWASVTVCKNEPKESRDHERPGMFPVPSAEAWQFPVRGQSLFRSATKIQQQEA